MKRFFYLFALIFLCKFSYGQGYKLSKISPMYTIPAMQKIFNISDLIQDHQGYIWTTSQNGLYKFDGYKLTRYSFDPNYPEKIAGNWIVGLAEDDSGHIWLGVFGIGLQKLNPLTGKFTLFRADPANPDALVNNRITQLKFINGKLWISTQEGLCRLSPGTGKFKTYSRDYMQAVTASGDELWKSKKNGKNFILSSYDIKLDSIITRDTIRVKTDGLEIYEIVNDKLFMTLDKNLYVYDINTKELSPVKTCSSESVTNVFYHVKRLYLSCSSSKIEVFDIEKESLQTYELQYDLGQYITNFLVLKNGDLWINAGIIYKVLIEDNGIESYSLMIDGQAEYTTNAVSFSEWESGYLGFGKSILIDFKNSSAIKATSLYPSLASLSSAYDFNKDYVKVYVDEYKDSWIAFLERSSYQVTFFKFSYSSKKLQKLGTSYSQGAIFGLTKIGNELWLASWNGLIKWDIPSNKSTVFEAGDDSSKLSSVGVRYCFKDLDEDLWIATQNGLNLKKKGENKFSHYFSKSGDTTSLSFNGITSITQDSAGIIWIGTHGGGVNRFNKKTGKFSWITTKQGLASDVIRNIIIDETQNAWIAHEEGFSKIDVKNEKVENFTSGNISIENQGVRMSDGSIILGGSLIRRIRPSLVRKDVFVSPIHITGFRLFNKPLLVNGPDSILHSDLNNSMLVALHHYQNVVSFEYAALDMSHPGERSYAYYLEGFDDGWQYVDKIREVTYTNLSHGKYVFRVKSMDRYGDWYEMKDPLHIIVLTPWWHSWLAYLLYSLMLALMVRGFILYRSKQLRRENSLLEAKIALRTKELTTSLKDLSEAQGQLIQKEKMASLGELTAGIAHEIQNPLNFINNFSDVNRELGIELQEELSKKNFGEAGLIAKDIIDNEEKINHHGKRADAIVKNMLQHSRSATGTKEPTDINALADEYLRLAYHGLRAKDKTFNASLVTDFDQNIGKVNIISQDVGRVMLNLYNNAFYAVAEKKKTHPDFNPEVSVSTKLSNGNVEITVKDNGNGIPETVVNKIFQPFFTTKPTGEGTGLGLSLSYDIIKAHGGEIKVESKTGMGAEFLITIPSNK